MDEVGEKVLKVKVKTAYILVCSIVAGIGSVYAVQLDHQTEIAQIELKISEELRAVDHKVDSMSGRLGAMESDLNLIKRHLINE